MKNEKKKKLARNIYSFSDIKFFCHFVIFETYYNNPRYNMTNEEKKNNVCSTA